MELKCYETLDFHKACTLLSAGYEMSRIEDFLSGNYREKVQPLMIFSPLPDLTYQVLDKKKHYNACMRSLYNQLKVKYFTADFFEFKDDVGWYTVSTNKTGVSHLLRKKNTFIY